MRFRQSMMSTWMRCSLQAKFKDIDGLRGQQGSRAAFGTCVHHALEQYSLHGDVDRALRAFLEVWDDPSLLGIEIDVWNKFSTAQGLRQKGVEIIQAYDAKNKITPRQVIFVEHPFLVPFGEHELTGTVDLGSIKENHHGKQLLMVEDWKTNGKAPNRTELQLNIQLTTYIYATLQPEFWLGNPSEPGFPAVPNGEWWWEMLKDVPRRGVWIQLMNDCKDIDAGERDDDDFMRLYRLCIEIEKAITRDVFVPTISGESCIFCDFANGPCPVRIPTQEEWDNRFESDANSWL